MVASFIRRQQTVPVISNQGISGLQNLEKSLSSLPISFHLVICNPNKITNILGRDHDSARIPQRHLHANGAANGDDDALLGIGNATLSKAAGDGEGNEGVSGGEVSALESNYEGLESEDEFGDEGGGSWLGGEEEGEDRVGIGGVV